MKIDGNSWWPTPRYLHRLFLLQRWLRRQLPCRVLEVGFGAGYLIDLLARQGCTVYGVDPSKHAHAATQARLARHRHSSNVTLYHTCNDLPAGFTADIVIAFEVLEHCTDDVGTLRTWRRFVRPGGKCILSVPAHMSKWSALDEWAGHVRRYERTQLTEVIRRAGLRVDQVASYGVPLCNLLERTNARHYANAGTQSAGTEDVTGVARDGFRMARYASHTWTLYPFVQLQRLFLTTDWGNGYVAYITNDTNTTP